MSFNVTNHISKSLSLTDANITFTGEILELSNICDKKAN